MRNDTFVVFLHKKVIGGNIFKDQRKSCYCSECLVGNSDLLRKEFTVSCSNHMMNSIEKGIIFTGAISIGDINMWEMLKIEFTYPRSAKAFLL